jgi:hypothetical protein
MKKSELKELVREIVGGFEPDGEGNLVRHNDKFDSTKLNSILKKIVDRDSEKSTVSENSIDFNEKEIQQQFPDLSLHYGFKGKPFDSEVEMGEIKSIRKRNLTDEEFEDIISFLEDRGYTVLRNKSTKDLDDDGDRWYYPSIIFTAPIEA